MNKRDLVPTNALVSSKQRLGILPTLSFWAEQKNWKAIRLPVSIFAGLLTGALSLVYFPLYLEISFALGSVLLFVGVFERLIREKMKQRALQRASNIEQKVDRRSLP